MRATSLLATLVVIAAAGHPLTASAEQNRYSRTVETEPGWSRLELGADVLEKAQADLSDVRLRSQDAELGYAWEHALVVPALDLEAYDVVSVPGRETTALVDRGPSRALARCVELELSGSAPLLKPLSVEASADGATYGLLARGSVFRLDGTRTSQLCFPPSDHRYLRLRLDDRNSEAVAPRTVRLEIGPPEQRTSTLVVALQREHAAGDASEAYSITLPHRQLPLRSLRLQVSAPVFSRRVSVHERLFFRGELSRRLLAEAKIERGIDGAAQLEVPLGPVSGTHLELVIEAAGPPLDLRAAEVTVRWPALIFMAPANASIRLEYGTPAATAPHYDVAAVLAHGLPRSLHEATLGPGQARSVQQRAAIARGAPLRREDFGWARVVLLPPSDETEQAAYIDLVDESVPARASLRLVDQQNRQVPYVLEVRRRTRGVELRPVQALGQRRVFELLGVTRSEVLTSIELSATGPEFFSRPVEVFREVRDQRGVVSRATLASGTWEREPGAAAMAFSLELPHVEGQDLRVAIDDGDNAPLQLAAAHLTGEHTRLDFFYQRGDELVLLGDHRSLGAPSYDLKLVADRLLQSAALEARLGAFPEGAVGTKTQRDMAWFWLALTAVGGALALVLVRAMLAERKGRGTGN